MYFLLIAHMSACGLCPGNESPCATIKKLTNTLHTLQIDYLSHEHNAAMLLFFLSS